jgi:hypothetical protein
MLGVVLLFSLPIAVICDFEPTALVIVAFLALSPLICILNSYLFIRKRNSALSNEPVTTGEIIGCQMLQHSRRTNSAILYVRLEDGRITKTPQIHQYTIPKIMSEKVNIYRHKQSLYVGDIDFISENSYNKNSDRQPIEIPELKLPGKDLMHRFTENE